MSNRRYYATDKYQDPKVNYSPRSKTMDDPLAVRIFLIGAAIIFIGLVLAGAGVIS